MKTRRTSQHVSLREKGVDLNVVDLNPAGSGHTVSLREKGVDLNFTPPTRLNQIHVSLREKGVDLNTDAAATEQIKTGLPS